MQTNGPNSEHKNSEIEHFLTLNERMISENSKDSIIVYCQ